MTANVDKKEMILENSAKIFAHKGYYGAGISEILKACEIPKGSFYHYFPDGKEQLAIEVLHYVYEKMVAGIEEDIFSTSSDAVVVFSKMADLLTEIFNSTEIFESLVLTFIGLESIYISDDLSRESKAIYIKWQEFYKKKLIACGYSEEDASDYSLTIFTLIHGSLISCWIKQDTKDLQIMKNQLPKLLKPKL